MSNPVALNVLVAKNIPNFPKCFYWPKLLRQVQNVKMSFTFHSCWNILPNILTQYLNAACWFVCVMCVCVAVFSMPSVV